MEPALNLLLDRRLLQMQFSRHPHKLDLVAQIIDQRGAFPLGPARVLELAQQEVGLAVFLQDRDAFRLGWMGGEHRADAQTGDQLLDLRRTDAGPRSLCQHVAKRAAQAFAAALALDLAAAAHGCVLLGDGEKLEPDALRLKRAGHELRRDIGDAGAAFEQRLDLRLMLARHIEEQAEQELSRLTR
jgi:hypothetical protein